MGDVRFPGKKPYEGVPFNVIGVSRGWVGVNFPGKKCYVTIEWPINKCCCIVTDLPGPWGGAGGHHLQNDHRWSPVCC